MRAGMRIRPLVVAALVVAFHPSANGRTSVDWTGYGRDSQHTAVSGVPGQRPLHVRWSTALDLAPQYFGDDLLIHYGSPLVTRRNTVIVTVKTGTTDGFRLEGRAGT